MSVKVYNGNHPYFFISYSHEDKERILPYINLLVEEGYRLWFDEGIEVGTKWAENITEHINSASSVMAFLSDNYLKSDNCMDEIEYAKNKKIRTLVIYIDDITVPDWFKMRYGRIQGVFCHQYNTKDKLLERIKEAKMFDSCLDHSVHKNNNCAETRLSQKYSEDLMGIIKSSYPFVSVNDLKRIKSEELGYSGSLEYIRSKFPFDVVLVKDQYSDLYYDFKSYYPLIINSKQKNNIEKLIILANEFLIGEAYMFFDERKGVCVQRQVSLTQTVTIDYIAGTMRTIGSIIYAFSPFFEGINQGEMNCKHNELIGVDINSAIIDLIPETINPDATYIELEKTYMRENWFKKFSRHYNYYRKSAEQQLIKYRKKNNNT